MHVIKQDKGVVSSWAAWWPRERTSRWWRVKAKVDQSCLTLWDHGLYSPWTSPGQSTGVGSLSLLQGDLPNLGIKPRSPDCRWMLYQLSCKGNPRLLEWIAYPSQPRNRTRAPALQADSLPTEPLVESKNTGVVSTSWQSLLEDINSKLKVIILHL